MGQVAQGNVGINGARCLFQNQPFICRRLNVCASLCPQVVTFDDSPEGNVYLDGAINTTLSPDLLIIHMVLAGGGEQAHPGAQQMCPSIATSTTHSTGWIFYCPCGKHISPSNIWCDMARQK